jgi:hypothetical protein
MPTVFEKDGFRFFFYSADYREPMHIHVEHADGNAKFWLRPIQLASSYKMRAADLTRARAFIEQNQKLCEEKWNEYFSQVTRS